MSSSASQHADLHKGEEVDLNKLDPGLHRVVVGLGWDAPPEQEGFAVDIDASAFLLNRDNRVRKDTDFVFYNNLETEAGAVRHRGDSLSGEGDGDDEKIEVKLDNIGFDVERIIFAVTIHNAEERRHTFGIVKNAYMRVVDADNGEELARFDLSEDAASDNAIIFGELSRDGDHWKFKALGQGSNGGLYHIARNYGVNVSPN